LRRIHSSDEEKHGDQNLAQHLGELDPFVAAARKCLSFWSGFIPTCPAAKVMRQADCAYSEIELIAAWSVGRPMFGLLRRHRSGLFKISIL
jgi:hypothetical protein